MRRFSFAAAVVFLVASIPAGAREIAIDTGDPNHPSVPIHTMASPGCASDLGGICHPFDLGFSANFGTGRTSKIYLYDDGQVTFGSPAAGGGATFGPGSVAGSLRAPLIYPFFYRTVYYQRQAGEFDVTWSTCATPGSNATDCFSFFQDVRLSIVADDIAHTVTIELDPSDTDFINSDPDAQFGYSLGSQIQPLARLAADSLFSVTIPTTVPEPATWSLLIAGFAASGAALRRRRRFAAAG